MNQPVNPRVGADAVCPIARSVDVLGQKWVLLIVREVMGGHTRFADIRARLGVASDVLTARLDLLVEHGVLARRTYREPGERSRPEYVLTDAGGRLAPVLAALAAWGEAELPRAGSTRVRAVDAVTGAPLRMAFVGADGRESASVTVRSEDSAAA